MGLYQLLLRPDLAAPGADDVDGAAGPKLGLVTTRRAAPERRTGRQIGIRHGCILTPRQLRTGMESGTRSFAVDGQKNYSPEGPRHSSR